MLKYTFADEFVIMCLMREEQLREYIEATCRLRVVDFDGEPVTEAWREEFRACGRRAFEKRHGVLTQP